MAVEIKTLDLWPYFVVAEMHLYGTWMFQNQYNFFFFFLCVKFASSKNQQKYLKFTNGFVITFFH